MATATVGDVLKAQGEQINALTHSVKSLTDRLSRTRDPNVPNPQDSFGPPHARKGEDPMSSRGFSFTKMLGLITGATDPSKAKVEIDVHNRLHNCLVKQAGGENYEYTPSQAGGQKFLAPLATSFLHDNYVDPSFRREMKSLVKAGVDGSYDLPDEMRWLQKRLVNEYGTKALSWLRELEGGSLVAPAEQGELIELMRNKEALVNAGARTVPLPPQGRIKYPRQTAASNAYWVGENAPITESTIGTGEVTLQAKKLAVFIKAPNELIRFASPAAEALMRDDMTKTLALTLDLAGLQGAGTDTQPRGILNMPNINRLTSSSPGANGDALVGQDIYRMIAIVEESNMEFQTFIMRPKTLYAYYQMRTDAVAQGDAQGPFLYNLIREAGDGVKPTLGGYEVVKSTQISQGRVKGSRSNLTYILGGNFNELLIGMFGAIEFASTTVSDGAFINDQTWIRGILSADIQARYEACFVLLDNLSVGGA